MKKILSLIVLIVAGLGVGAGSGYAALTLVGGPRAGAATPATLAKADTRFVPAKVLAPLVSKDGHLTGYVELEFQLEVTQNHIDFVADRLPLLLHAINLRTFRTPMASGPDGMLPSLDSFRKVVTAASQDAFGARVIRRVAITRATPA